MLGFRFGAEGIRRGARWPLPGLLRGGGFISGTASGTSTVTGDLGLISGISGTAAGVATVSGNVSTGGEISGTAAGTSTVTADVGLLVGISGTAAGAATVTGNIQASTADIAGTAAGAATVTGDVGLEVGISGTAAGTATASADVGAEAGVAGTTAGVATVSADVGIEVGISGTAAGAATVTANVTDILLPITSGLVLQHESDLGVTEVSGEVTVWEDQSSSGYDFTPDGTDNGLAFSATGAPNGRPALTANGTDEHMSVQTVTGLPTGSEARTICCVCKYESDASHGGSYHQGNGTTGTDIVLGRDNSTDVLEVWIRNDQIESSEDGPALGWFSHVVTVASNGDTAMYANNTSVATGNLSYNTGSDDLRIGKSNGSSYSATDILAIYVWDRVLSSGELATLQTYLETKWGI